jgi:DNA-binding GntR family transcriptional regulator
MAVKTARRSGGARARPNPEQAGENGTLADRAYRKLEEEIVTLRLAPGTMVSEAVLSRRLGIGRMPIREALQRLSRERLVVIMPKRGIVVAEVNVGSQLRLLEARREIERLLSRLAARRATAEQRARFDQIAAGMDKAGDADDDATFIGLDREYNLLVMEAARNEYAAGAMTLMHGLSRRFWYIHYKKSADLPLTARLHADIARAIAAADQDAAAAASDRLLDYIETFTRATLADG